MDTQTEQAIQPKHSPPRGNALHGRLIVIVCALALVLAGAGARWHRLGEQSLWNDEGNAYVQATRDPLSIAENAARDIHPPGYYWALGAWRILTGETEFALRALSALAGVLTVAFTYALGARLYGGLAGLVAALVIALNTFSIYYGQEARMYALLALLSAGAMWAFVGFVRARTPARRWRWGLALAAFNTAGLWTQYVYPSVMIVQGVAMLAWLIADLRESRDLRHRLGVYVAVNLLTVALFLPWLPVAWGQITTWPNTGQAIPLADALAQIIGWLTLGITYEYTTFGVPILFILLFGVLTRAPDPHGRLGWHLLLPPLWVGVTLGGFLALGMFREANLKLLLPAQIGWALWIGRGLWVVWHLPVRRTAPLAQASPRLAAVGGALVLALSLVSGMDALYNAPQFQRDDYRGIVREITSAPVTPAVILNAPGQSEVFGYYAGDLPNVYRLPIGMTVDEEATLRELEGIIRRHDRIAAVLWGTDERDPQNLVQGTLDRDTFQVDSRWFGDVRLVRYVTPRSLEPEIESGVVFGGVITLAGYRLSGTRLAPGDALQVQLRWRAGAPLDTPYKVFVQLLNPDGKLAHQRDSEPAGGTQPTPTWEPQADVIDNHALLLPPDLPAGDYTLIVGLYPAHDPFSRLLPDATGESFVVLGVVRVTPATPDEGR